MCSYKKNIDTCFDKKFIESGSFTWLPWVGVNFSKSKVKTLILGDSTKNWGKLEATKIDVGRRLKINDYLRIAHVNNAINFNGVSPYCRNLESAVYNFDQKKGDRTKAKANAKTLWEAVSYHNLVLEPMCNQAQKPTKKQIIDGWPVVLMLFEILKIDQCVVYGLAKPKVNALKKVLKEKNIELVKEEILDKISGHFPRVITVELDGREVKILFVLHPSWYSWRKWGAIIRHKINWG